MIKWVQKLGKFNKMRSNVALASTQAFRHQQPMLSNVFQRDISATFIDEYFNFY
jgi:hypothetical protein